MAEVDAEKKDGCAWWMWSLFLLVVLWFIFGLFVPPLTPTYGPARKAESNQQISNLTTAIKGYQMEYGHVPLRAESGTTDLTTDSKDQALIECLMGIPLAAPTTDYKNEREISFYEPKYVKANKGGWNDSVKALYDPWGTEYRIALDTNFDKHINVRAIWKLGSKDPDPPGARTDVAIMSAGPDQVWGTQDDLYSWTK